MARYLIDRYSGKEYGPAKQTNKQNKSLFRNVQVPRYHDFMDKVIFFGERGKAERKTSPLQNVFLFFQ